MKAIIRNKPLYLLLLSLFFVYHGYVENFDFIPLKDIFLLLLVYLLATIVLTAIFRLVYKNWNKAALLAFFLMCFYFFFGAIYDSLANIAPNSFLVKYSVFLSIFFLLIIAAAIFLFRFKKPLRKLNYVLNVFFLLLLFVDSAWLISKMFRGDNFSDRDFQKEISVCDTCAKPDIFLIVADEYAGDQALRETMHFDNHEFKDQLKARGFYTPSSSSNYAYTPFSMASTLDMQYLRHVEGTVAAYSRDLSTCYKLVRENKVFQLLYEHGYELHNFSIFDIHDQPAIMKETILPGRTRFITAQTMLQRLDYNLLFNMEEDFSSTAQRKLMLPYRSNMKAIDSLKQCASQRSSRPKFVYTHLYMPHFPYYFDSEGLFRNTGT